MKKLDEKTLSKITKKLMFNLSEEEVQTILNDFAVIEKQIELINKAPGVDEAEPAVYPYDLTCTELREDSIGGVLDKNEALKNISDTSEGMVKIPKVVK